MNALAGLAVVVLLVAACSDGSSDPDPGAPGGQTEIDGGETGTDSGTTTPSVAGGGTTGGTSGGGTQGNQIPPGDTTPQTAQDTS
jgi:hypothetical protein